MSPRPTTGHVRRPAILKAAAEVIAERGVIGTRIADVAERADTSAPGVLYWFATKDELLTEALSFADDRFYAELSDELAQLDGARARLARIVELWPAEGDAEAVLWMELWVRALRDPEVGAARERLDGRWRAAIADVVREGQAAGEFAARRPRRVRADARRADGRLRDPTRAARSGSDAGAGARALHGAGGRTPGTGGST